MKLAAMMRNVPPAVLLSLPLAAGAAEYMEKTPFQLSRAFSPGVVSEGGRIVWVAGQTATRDSQGADIYPGSALITVSNFARPGIEIEIQAVGVIGDRCSSEHPCSAEGQAKKR